MTSYSSEQILKTNLTISPSELHKDISNVVKQKLKGMVEGVCYEDGYIIKDSIEIIKRSPGRVVTHNKASGIQYIITYKAKIITPCKGDVYEAFISNINKMGAIAFIKLKKEDTEEDSPVIIIIPKEYFEGTRWNIDDLNKGQTIQIEIVGTRIKYQSEKIQIVGKPI